MTGKSHPEQTQDPDHPCHLHPAWPPDAFPQTGLRPVDTLEQLAHVRSHLLKHRHSCCRAPHPGGAEVPAGAASSRTGKGNGGGNGTTSLFSPQPRGRCRGKALSRGRHAAWLPRDFFPAGAVGACAYAPPEPDHQREKKLRLTQCARAFSGRGGGAKLFPGFALYLPALARELWEGNGSLTGGLTHR